MLRFTGFGLGIWQWPIVNALLERMKDGVRLSSQGSLTPTMANKEVWTWEDYRGRKRELVIHREIKEA